MSSNKQKSVGNRRAARAILSGAAAIGLFVASASPAAANSMNFNVINCSMGQLVAIANTINATGSVTVGVRGLSGQGTSENFFPRPVTNSLSWQAPWGGTGYGFAQTFGEFRVTSGATRCGA